MSSLLALSWPRWPSPSRPCLYPRSRLLEAELTRFPARSGVYVTHLTTGEKATVRVEDAFSSASIIKLTILVRAFQLVDRGKRNLDERAEIRRADLRDGSGVLQYRDLGQTPTITDLLTENVIASDNAATDQLLTRVGGVDSLNAWLKASGFAHLSMVARGHVYRRKILALVNPAFDSLTAEETTGLHCAQPEDSSRWPAPAPAAGSFTHGQPAARRSIGGVSPRDCMTCGWWCGSRVCRVGITPSPSNDKGSA